MAKAFSKNIIGQELLDLSNESSITTNNKAKIFMSAIVSRINLDSNAFDVFLSLLKEVESLGYMIERLKQEVANLQRGGQLAHNTSVQTTAQMPKLDVHEEPNIKTNDDKDLTEVSWISFFKKYNNVIQKYFCFPFPRMWSILDLSKKSMTCGRENKRLP